MEITGKKIAFITGLFPVVSETWLINQVVDLRNREIDVEVFSFNSGDFSKVSDKFFKYNLDQHTRYLGMPKNLLWRIFVAIPKIFRLAFKNPGALARALNFKKYGKRALSLQLIFWAEPFVGKKFDFFHCHHGTIANRFLDVRYVLGIKEKMITTFYGQDVSRIFKAKGEHYYDELKKVSSAFIVMSNFMKDRIIDKGFDKNKILVLPIFGIDVSEYPFQERRLKPDEPIQMVTVGRFVEKKGFDDLLRAIAIVKKKTDKKFLCNIIGDGELGPRLRAMSEELGLTEVVSFKGYMKIEEIINYFLSNHFYLQPSKTASNGDME